MRDEARIPWRALIAIAVVCIAAIALGNSPRPFYTSGGITFPPIDGPLVDGGVVCFYPTTGGDAGAPRCRRPDKTEFIVGSGGSGSSGGSAQWFSFVDVGLQRSGAVTFGTNQTVGNEQMLFYPGTCTALGVRTILNGVNTSYKASIWDNQTGTALKQESFTTSDTGDHTFTFTSSYTVQAYRDIVVTVYCNAANCFPRMTNANLSANSVASRIYWNGVSAGTPSAGLVPFGEKVGFFQTAYNTTTGDSFPTQQTITETYPVELVFTCP